MSRASVPEELLGIRANEAGERLVKGFTGGTGELVPPLVAWFDSLRFFVGERLVERERSSKSTGTSPFGKSEYASSITAACSRSPMSRAPPSASEASAPVGLKKNWWNPPLFTSASSQETAKTAR